MRTVSGSLNRDWNDLVPGDLVVSTERLNISWPPDGARYQLPGPGFRMWPPITGSRIEPGEPFTIVSHVRRGFDGIFEWHRGTWSLIFYNHRLWWVGTSASGSMM